MRTRGRSWPAVLALTVALAGLSAPGAPRVYGESLMVKVRPDTPPRAAAPVELRGARNEVLSFQVVIHGGDSGAPEVRASLESLDGPTRIGSSQLLLYREDLLDVTEPSGGPSAPGRWPDALVPAVDEVSGEPRNAFPFDVPVNEARALWVDVFVPEDAPPGDYHGEVRVRARGGFTASVPVTLTVVDLTLPSTPSYPTSFGLDGDLVCEAHTGRKDCGTDTVRMQLLERYARLALDHRLTLSNALALPTEPGAWERFDATFGPLLDGTAPTRLRGARMTSVRYTGPLEDQALAAFVAHFSARGWMARAYDYTGDEPPYFSTFDEVRARAAVLERAAPELTRMVTTWLPLAHDNGLDGLIGRMSVIVQFMRTEAPADGGTTRADYESFLARPGTSLWMYQSCISHGCVGDPGATEHWPSYMVDHPANLNRAMPWTVFLLRASGETYYETAARLGTAWTDVHLYGGNGDGTLFYPGTVARIGGQSDVPLPSLRLKLLRAGVQDYEWLELVSRGDAAFAGEVARALIPAPDRVPLEPEAFERARARLIERALQLATEEPPDDPPSSSSKGGGCGCDAGPPEALLALGLGGLLWALKRRGTSGSPRTEVEARARTRPCPSAPTCGKSKPFS